MDYKQILLTDRRTLDMALVHLWSSNALSRNADVVGHSHDKSGLRLHTHMIQYVLMKRMNIRLKRPAGHFPPSPRRRKKGLSPPRGGGDDRLEGLSPPRGGGR